MILRDGAGVAADDGLVDGVSSVDAPDSIVAAECAVRA